MQSNTRMAICYDFDKTLSPDDMQSFTFIKSVGMDNAAFWAESNEMSKVHLMDRNLAWMRLMIDKATQSGLSIQREAFQALGKDVTLFSGVRDWFALVNRYGQSKGITIEHYIISSGLKEIIEGSDIAPSIKRIYASSFLYNEQGSAVWPAQVVNYTNKTQFIFRIAKGVFEENDDSVNQTMHARDLYLPYHNMVYIGDSDTDIPSMRVLKNKGGFAIGVYNPELNNHDKVYDLYREERIDLFAPADYTEGSQLYGMMTRIVDMVAARAAIAADQNMLDSTVEPYARYSDAACALQCMGCNENDVERLLQGYRAEASDGSK